MTLITMALVDITETPNTVTTIDTPDDSMLPVSTDTYLWVDLTDIDPQPDVGWEYDRTSMTFTQPTQDENRAALMTKGLAALQANATFLALATPTTAQAVAQVQALTRQVDAMIRLVGGYLDTTGGT